MDNAARPRRTDAGEAQNGVGGTERLEASPLALQRSSHHQLFSAPCRTASWFWHAELQRRWQYQIGPGMEPLIDGATNFVIHLSREPNLKFRGVYAMDAEGYSGECIYGIGPKDVNSEMVREFLKYDSVCFPSYTLHRLLRRRMRASCVLTGRPARAQGTKSFKSIDTKALSMTTDAVVLHPHLSKVARRVRDLY